MRKIVVEYNGPHGYRPVEPMEGPPLEALPAKIEAATGGEDDVTKTASAADGEDDDWGDYATDKPKFLMTDLGNAERFAATCGRDFCFIHPWSKWLIWDKRRWKLDDSGRLGRAAKHVVRQIHTEARVAGEKNPLAGVMLSKWATKSEDKRHIDSMISLARAELPGAVDKLDQNPWLLNLRNGTLNLSTGRLGPHRREDLITKLCPVEYNENATCPTWEACLTKIFAGDEELIAFWQRLCGIALTSDVSEQILPIAYGGGANGKSTILGTLIDMLGQDYAMKAAPDLLMVKRFAGHPTERADLLGMRLVVGIESGEGVQINETLIKELTGGDKIRARRMREDFWEFHPTHTLILCTNHKPIVRGIDHAIWRRLLLIPFEITIPTGEQDTALPSKLAAERPGILAWCVRGCRDWTKNGLRPPEKVIAATAEYRGEQDWFEAFVAEHCTVEPNPEKRETSPFKVRANALYSEYKSWAENAGEQPRSLTVFGEAVKTKGFPKLSSGGTWYYGIELNAKPNHSDYTDR